MAKTEIGCRGMENAVRSLPPGESVTLLARAYDKLVKDLEYALLHVSTENLTARLRERLEREDT
jgi:hypothetical protein